MKPIAIITARGGSKRIPKKNIKNFLGKPIIAYSIQACLKSKLFSDVIVSTDDPKIARISKKFGASVPFLRSKRNSTDYAGTDDVILEVIQQLGKTDVNPESFCIVYPTAALIDSATLIKMKNIFHKQKYDSMMTITHFPSPIQRALRSKKGKLDYWKKKYQNYRSQDLEPLYQDAGQVYWIRTKAFLKRKSLITKKMGGFYLSPYKVQDIDTIDDWKMAELKAKLLRKK